MKLQRQCVQNVLTLRLRSGTMELAQEAANAGASVEEVQAIIKAGFLSAAKGQELVTYNPVELLTDNSVRLRL